MDFASLLNWKAEGMRFTLFTNNPSVDHDDWWTYFTGLTPESKINKPATSEHLHNGQFAQGALDLRILPDRIDWIYSPLPTPVPNIPSVGVFNEQLVVFTDGLIKWLNSHDAIYSRVAFSTTILKNTEDRLSGYKELNDLLPFMPLSTGTWKDFFMQFNKPVILSSSQFERMELNRLINYSIAHLQMMTFNNAVFTPTQKNYVRVEFDINTPAEIIFDFNKKNIEPLVTYLTDIVDVARMASEV